MPTPLRRHSGPVGSDLCRILLSAVVGILLLAALPVQAQQPVMSPAGDPPSEVARLSVALGDVSVEPVSVDQFSAAEVNDVLTSGDRIYADVGSNAELETGQLAVRLGQQTDLTVTAMTDPLQQFGLAEGSVHLRSLGLNPGTTVELDTPNAAVTVLQPGDVRVDVDPNAGTTTVTLVSGQAQVDADGFEQVLETGQRVRLQGSHPVSAQWLYLAQPDGLDGFSNDRDDAYQSAMEDQSGEVNPATIGAEDLSANGDWETDAEEGPVWYPAGVAVGWTPYSVGRWGWVAPWGWTWIEAERWGFAPFHYGRWEHRGNRWGWIPGPPVVRPIYSPAMVAFVGQPRMMAGDVGVTAWFPLGPRETYAPWYNASSLYLNRVNVSNVYSRNVAEVRAVYNQPTVTGAYAGGAADQRYVNRSQATVAVTQAGFAAGRPVGQSMVRVGAGVLAAAPVLPHPLVTPQRSLVVPTPARAVPVHVARPVLASRAVEEATSQAASRMAAGSALRQQAPGPARIQGSPQLPTLERTPSAEQVQGAAPIPGELRIQGVDQNRVVRQPAAAAPAPVARPVEPPSSASYGLRTEPTVRPSPAAQPGAEPMVLYHRVAPPDPRPSFDQQQRAIQSIDPGRPLGPQQLDNLRQNRPAGPPQQREVPHPVPAPVQRPVPVSRPDPSPYSPKR